MTQAVGFIGTGMIGSALARLTVAAGIDIILSNSRGPDSLREFAAELGPRATAATVEDAATKADIVIAAVPLSAYKGLPADLLRGKVVIDTMNYYPSRDGHMQDIDEAKLTTSELIQQHLKGAKVVKALFNLDFHHLYINARPHGDPERTTLPIAGDDEVAKSVVAAFMDRIGYDSLDIGSLSESWRIEPGTPIYVWPYVPSIPAHLNAADRRKWYREHSGESVTREMAQDLVDKAVRSFPVGGFPEVLPPEHVELVAEIYRKRRG
jgi:8-hydroxy-5-deazaflavin:NADPH oxidoreductase